MSILFYSKDVLNFPKRSIFDEVTQKGTDTSTDNQGKVTDTSTDNQGNETLSTGPHEETNGQKHTLNDIPSVISCPLSP